jgi:hypothetical protein
MGWGAAFARHIVRFHLQQALPVRLPHPAAYSVVRVVFSSHSCPAASYRKFVKNLRLGTPVGHDGEATTLVRTLVQRVTVPEFERSTVAAIISLRADRHLQEGLARTQQDVDAVVSDNVALDTDPGRVVLAWKYGPGSDVLDPNQRTLELRNWLVAQVLPHATKR